MMRSTRRSSRSWTAAGEAACRSRAPAGGRLFFGPGTAMIETGTDALDPAKIGTVTRGVPAAATAIGAASGGYPKAG